MRDRPLLYVSFPWPETTDEDRAATEAVAAEAVALGWAVTSQGWISGVEMPLEARKEVADALVRSCDAFLVVKTGRSTPWMDREKSAFETTWRRAPVYSTKPGSPLGSHALVAPPWDKCGEAAERVNVEGWACRTCRRFWGNDEHGERIARWCCAKEQPCSGCKKPTEKHRSFCRDCQETREAERHAKRERAPWDGETPFISDVTGDWFHGMDQAEDKAMHAFLEREGRDPDDKELKAELESMRLLVGEPVLGREVDIAEHLSDDMPDESDGFVLRALDEPTAALNAAIKALGPLSYTASDVAIDIEGLEA